MMKKQIIEEIRDLLEKAYRERLYNIILIKQNIDVLYPLSCRLGRRISAKPVDKNDYETVVFPLYENAHNEGVIA